MPRLMSWTVACLAAALQISAADAQGNIDAGKTPAQIFGDTCAGCHRSARELRRASASFLRSHYTAGSDEASAMANYLAGVGGGGGEPRSSAATQSQPKRPPADVAKQPGRPAVEQPKSGSASAAAPGSAQPPSQPKNRPTTSAQARALPDSRALPEARAFQEERHVEPTPSASPPVPVLQPFEE